MTAWAHLPNAALIERVLKSLKERPEAWEAAWDAAGGAAQYAVWGPEAGGAAWDAARGAGRGAAWDAARDASWGATSSWGTAWRAAWGAISALVAYDDAGELIEQPVSHLQRLHRIDPHPVFYLLQPASIVLASQRLTCHTST